MRTAAVSQMKGVTTGICLMRDRPDPATKIGRVYDMLMANKGRPVDIDSRLIHYIMFALTDYYGLDVRQVQRLNRRKGTPSSYVLAGEWFGRVYVDYIAERLETAQ